ncbi:hypothetical protein [Flavobacterium psychrophilum]|uniref:hypothetical protein n=1 Tax=Flavobacterium psychrophilum TaxID=96345 RepID=UPI001D08C86D|nr:hypothetical protein [Flavobacterium psychrophilum]ELV7526137.1 hypothetical protein [Flavobacterium psychrophilum]MCB6062339.1 hypothetical protein [Flavobacterium psychrophilum]
MYKTLKTFLLIILISSSCFGQKKSGKTVEQQCKEFSAWFKTLSPSEKRSAANELVYKLNSMDSHSRGLWLATLDSLEKKDSKTPIKQKKDLPKEMSEEEKLNAFQGKIREEINTERNIIKSIKVIYQYSNAEIATNHNSALQKRIDTLQENIKNNNLERSKLKPRIPANYKYEELDYDNQGNYIKDSIKPIYKKYLNYGSRVESDFALVNKYKEMFLEEENVGNWSDETKNHYLFELITVENNGLEDNEEQKRYFKCSYYPPVLEEENIQDAEVNIQILENYNIINNNPLSLIFPIPKKVYPY